MVDRESFGYLQRELYSRPSAIVTPACYERRGVAVDIEATGDLIPVDGRSQLT